MDYYKWSGSDVRGFDHEPSSWHASLAYATFGGRTQVMVPSGSTIRHLGKSPLGSPPVLFHRMYVTFPTNLASGSNVIARALTSGNQQAWRLRRGSNGTVVIDGPTNGLSTSLALAAGTEWRLEWRTSATDLQLRIYEGESTTPFDTRTVTASFLLGDNAQFGQLLATPALPTFYMRDILITDDGWTGPSPAPGPIIGKRSAAIGDSLTSQSGANGKYILDELVRRGMPTRNLYLLGVGGKRISQPDTSNSGNNANNRTTPQNMEDAVVQLGGVDHWLFCLGTNDRPFTSAEVDGYIDTVHAKVDALTPGAKVTWLTLTSKVAASADDVRLNGLLAAKVAARANTTLADWNTHIRAIDGGAVLPWWLDTTDTVHMSSVGYPVRAAFQVDQIQDAPPSTTGTVAQTLPALTAAAAGATTPPAFTGAIAASLPGLTQSAAAVTTVPVFDGSISAALPALTSAASGSVSAPVAEGTIAAALPALTSAASGVVTDPGVTGTIAAILPALASAAVGVTDEPGSRMVFTPTSHRPGAAKIRPRPLPPPVWPRS